jgi:integrase
VAEPVKRGDMWSVRIELPPDPVTGERKRTRLTARTKRELEALVAKTRTNVQEGTYVQPDKQSFGAYLTYWLETHGGNLRATTLASYRQTVDKHIIPALGAVPLQKLTAGQLHGYYAAKLTSGRADGKGGLSSRTVR